MAGWPLFVYPKYFCLQNKPAERRSHPHPPTPTSTMSKIRTCCIVAFAIIVGSLFSTGAAQDKLVLLDGRQQKGEIYWEVDEKMDSWGIPSPLQTTSDVTFRDMSNDNSISVRHFLKNGATKETVKAIALGGGWLTIEDVQSAILLNGIQRIFVDSELDTSRIQSRVGVEVIRSHWFVVRQLRDANDPVLHIVGKLVDFSDTPERFRFRLLEVSRGRNSYPVWASPLSLERIQQIVECETLEHLDLSGSAITDEHLANVKKLKRLKTLWIDSTHISSMGLEELCSLALERLDLSDNQIDGFPILSSLRELRLCNSRVSQVALDKVCSCPSLKVLDLRGAKLPSDAKFQMKGVEIKW